MTHMHKTNMFHITMLLMYPEKKQVNLKNACLRIVSLNHVNVSTKSTRVDDNMFTAAIFSLKKSVTAISRLQIE